MAYEQSGDGNAHIKTEPLVKTGPLVGVRVVELGSTVAGPFCARLLGDFGADVIKIEQPEGDTVRTIGKKVNGRSLYAASLMRGKRIIAVNLRTDDGRSIARKLCEKADVVVENFRPGTLEKWGLGFDELSKVNPKIVMTRVSGFGQDGPYSHRPGYGVTSEAMSGLRAITGYPDQPPPRVATPLTDYIAGLYAAFGTVMAVMSARETGQGQIVDQALYEGAFSFMEPHIPAFQKLGEIAQPTGSRMPGMVPNTLFPTADGGYIHVAAIADGVFTRLAALIGKPELAQDKRFSTAAGRNENELAITEIVEAWTMSHGIKELEIMLEDASVPAARIYYMNDIFEDPHFQARGMLQEVADPDLGTVTLAGVVPKLSRTAGSFSSAGQQIGQHSREILDQELGLSDEEITELATAGVVSGC
ncbi:MAG: crotonobetainyl-CoA:carnitine CoA-transferase CaiB-like acyl-CoA transferase [Hyphomicrobiaceae bacterium]|jgi:crotonobetainyl-CoA:carnitine CoA-transferase CaiB-like acyl-CoA transferase